MATNEYRPLQWLWEVRDTEFENPLERLLAYHLLAYADADGTCYPSVDRLCLTLGVKQTQTKKLRKSLVERGLLELVKKGNGPGREPGRASIYRLTLPSSPVTNPVTLSPNNPVTRSDHQEVQEEIQQPSGTSRTDGTDSPSTNGIEVVAALAAPLNGNHPPVYAAVEVPNDGGLTSYSDTTGQLVPACPSGGRFRCSGDDVDICLDCGVNEKDHSRPVRIHVGA